MGSEIRTVIGSDGTHMESELGGMRWNLTTGEMSTVIGAPGDGFRTVIRPDGSSIVEQQTGSLRFSSDGRFETIF